MSSSEIIKNAEAIISIDARGFIFGSAISLQSIKTNDCSKKVKQASSELFKEEYSLEYGRNSLSIQKKHFKNLILLPSLMIYWQQEELSTV